MFQSLMSIQGEEGPVCSLLPTEDLLIVNELMGETRA